MPYRSGGSFLRLSVCIITYNHEAFIEQAVESTLRQTVNFDYEVIVGEDCSTDATRNVLARLEALYRPRLKVIFHNPNIGSRANFNKTLAACTGEYVAFLEGDDFWTSNRKLQLQVDFLDEHPFASGVFHRTRAVNEADPSRDYDVPSADPPKFCNFGFLMQDNNPIALSSLVARRACLDDLGLWLANIKPGDWLLCMSLASKGDLGFLPLQMSQYRMHAGGDWQQRSPHQRVATTIRMLRHAHGLVPEPIRPLVEKRIANLASWWSNEMVYNRSLSSEGATKELDAIGDCELSDYLLAQVISVARATRDAQAWHMSQAKAWEEAATRAASDASAALAENERLFAATQELHATVAELKEALAARTARNSRR